MSNAANDGEPAPTPQPLVAEAPAIHAAWPSFYGMLDSWRGIAALGVVLQHTIPHLRMEFGHVAVMLFFVISGYCVTAAAESAMRRGTGFRRFMWRRFRRIYPPYILSVLFFLFTRLIKMHRGGTFPDRTAVEWLQNLTLTQWITLVFHPSPLPLGNASLMVLAHWSLGYEEQFYLVVAVLMAFGAIVSRKITLALMAASLAFIFFGPRLCFGFFLEYWAQFAFGAIVFYRLCRIETKLIRRVIDVSLVAAAITSTVIFLKLGWHSDTGTRPVWLELSVTSSFAVLLILLRPLNDWFVESAVGGVLGYIGLVSYSLYLIHQFNLVLIGAIASRIVAQGSMFIALQVFFHIGLASLFWYFCERPFLNHKPALARAHD